MPATSKPPARLLGVAEVLDRLHLSRTTFYRRFAWRFTDRRPADARSAGYPLMIPEDEVNVVVEKGWEALDLFRQRLGRSGGSNK
jgi:hypothetical protein